MGSKPLRIGKLARLGGVGVETVRFYERKGLIEQPLKRPSGFRQYPPEAVSRLRFIRRAKDLGFSLAEIKELMALRLAKTTPCHDVLARTEAKLIDVRAKIEALRQMEEALQSLTEACHHNTLTTTCPIIDALEPPEVSSTG